MYNDSRRYRKNDWWDLVTVIEQELERSKSYDTYFYIVDELKWRIVDSVSEGANFKIRNKAKEIQKRFHEDCSELDGLSEIQKSDIDAIFDLIISSKRESF
ncbi:hypothetical protein [Halobacteriovorax sp.]|uniref:hypothetical protein n=1 Tax=Halobacteriovorax sp. TaxID=2020862 RepID=UPI0035673EDF